MSSVHPAPESQEDAYSEDQPFELPVDGQSRASQDRLVRQPPSRKARDQLVPLVVPGQNGDTPLMYEDHHKHIPAGGEIQTNFLQTPLREWCSDREEYLGTEQRASRVCQTQGSRQQEANPQPTLPVCDVGLGLLDLWDMVNVEFPGFREIDISNQWRSVAIRLGVNIYMHRWAPLALRYVYTQLLSGEIRPTQSVTGSTAVKELNQLLLGPCCLSDQ